VLRSVENASVTFRFGLFSVRKGHVRLQIGRQIVDFGSVPPKGVSRAPSSAEGGSLRLVKIGERTYWQFQDRVYGENQDLDANEVKHCSSHSSSVSEVGLSVRKPWLRWVCNHRTSLNGEMSDE
jgi:hypothetical protein